MAVGAALFPGGGPIYRNLPALQMLTLLFFFDVTVPLRQVIYSEGGLSQTAVGIILTVPWVVILLTDLPTGRIADAYSYKFVLVVGCLCLSASFMLLAVADEFWPLFASALLLGIGSSCYRGVPQTLSRLTFRVLQDKDAETQYQRFTSRNWTYAAVGEMIASLVTFGLVQLYPQRGVTLAILFQAMVCLVMIGLTLRGITDIRPIDSPKQGLGGIILSGWMDTWRRLQVIFRQTPLVRAIILYGAVIGCTTQTMVWLAQIYLQATGIGASISPLIWAAYHAVLAVFLLWIVTPYQSILGRRRALASLPLIAITAYMCLIWMEPLYGMWVIVAFYFIRAVQTTILAPYLLPLVSESLGATVLAVMSTVQFVLFVAMNVTLNACVEYVGLEAAFLLSAVVYGTAGIWTARQLR